jgi:glycosyltransferase involved in cell wall biosynthesis
MRVAEAIFPIVIAPTYNNCGTLAEVLAGVAAVGLPILVVNDGSTDQTAAILEEWVRKHPQTKLLTHPRNRGKAAALRTGFAAAIELGYTHAVTIDTDLQHDPAYIGPLLEAAREDPDAFVLGVRDIRHGDYPTKSRVGRRISNLLIRLECGVKVSDSQCGMRVWPLELIREVRGHSSRFGYESEMITRAGWAGCPIVEVLVNTRYLPADQRISHFRPWVDTLRSAAMHARLLARTVLPIPHVNYHPHGKPLRKKVTLRDLLRWMNPMRAWRELREGRINRTEFATALSVGVFVANLPVYPFQTVCGLYLARRLHLNPLAVLAGSQLSTPPVGIALIGAAIWVGHLLLHGSMMGMPALSSAQGIWEFMAKPILMDWIVGAPLVGFVLAGITFVLANHFYRGADEDEEPVGSVGAVGEVDGVAMTRKRAS